MIPVPTAVPPNGSSLQPIASLLKPANGELRLPRVSTELLAQTDWGRILQMRPSDLDDLIELSGFGGESAFCNLRIAGIKMLFDRFHAAMCIAVGITSLLDCPILT